MSRLLIILAVAALMNTGCNGKSEFYNPYHVRMKKLADKARAKPNDKAALHALENYTHDSNYWNRCYAFGFLGELASENVGGCQPEVLPFIGKALNDADPGVRRTGGEAILDIGAPAVAKFLPTLLRIVADGKEDDVTCFVTKAVGKSDTRQLAQEALPTLLSAASKAPDPGVPESAPQIRYYALDSIVALANNHLVPAVPELVTLLANSPSPYNLRVAKAILAIDPSNASARAVSENQQPNAR